MRLSEAIRLGCTLTGPYHGSYYVEAQIGHNKTTSLACALGAAACAMGHNWLINRTSPWSECWPWLLQWSATCPVCGHESSYHNVIVCLNDRHYWTRERIADWVATREPEGMVNGAAGTAGDAEGCNVAGASGDGLLEELQSV